MGLSDEIGGQSRIIDLALSSIPDFVYVFDRAGRFVYVNKPLLDLWGLKLEEAVGKNFFDLQYPEELAARLQDQIERVFQTGVGVSDETAYTSPFGVVGYFEYIFRPVYDSNGQASVVAGSTRDITARKAFEEERKELLTRVEYERNRFAGLFEKSPAFLSVLRGPKPRL